MIWIRSMEASNTFGLFSFLYSYIYVRYRSFLFQVCPSLSKTIFFLEVFATCHHWALSPQLLSISFLCFFCEFCYFWHSFQNILESLSWFYWKYSLYFCFPFFLLDDFQEEEKTGFMQLWLYQNSQWNIFTQINIKILNWCLQTLSRHFRVKIAWEVKDFNIYGTRDEIITS